MYLAPSFLWPNMGPDKNQQFLENLGPPRKNLMRISLFLNPKSMLYQKSKILSMIPISLVLSLVNFRHKYHHNRSEKMV